MKNVEHNYTDMDDDDYRDDPAIRKAEALVKARLGSRFAAGERHYRRDKFFAAARKEGVEGHE